jgi:hypothetical protein
MTTGATGVTDRVRVTVTINGVDYRCFPIAAGSGGIRAFRLSKQAGAGDVYDVVQVVGGIECDCADAVFRRNGLDPRGCKHARALRAAGLLG